ncbi:MAG: DNA repair helicase XPB [Spirochaetota bacterium]
MTGSMHSIPENPLIIQSDKTILLEVQNPLFEKARDSLLRFAELEKSPEYIHTYRLTPVSVWNAASSGMSFENISGELSRYAKYPVPHVVIADLREWLSRYGRLKLIREGEKLVLQSDDAGLFAQLRQHRKIARYIYRWDGLRAYLVEWSRGQVKKECIDIGYPVIDRAGFVHGEPFPIRLNDDLVFREYQRDAVSVFMNFEKTGGSGVVVLPCGAGKTIVGMGVMAGVGEKTLILVTNVTAARQWKRELGEKTGIDQRDIGEYSGERKEVRPITIATYQIMTYRRNREEDFEHLSRLNNEGWGLVVYDEVHLLPAPVFRFSCEIQSRRRLGLTATLVREDGRERDVFSLIGPKVYDVPWKILEKQGWIAGALCTEIRVDLPPDERNSYALADGRERFRRASVNRKKYGIVKNLLEVHRGESILIIGQYIDQLERIARMFSLPIITGKTIQSLRDELYERFRRGDLKVLVVSKVANFAVDLPDASVAIQVSGTFGSRQEEAQRLGRILRPKGGRQAFFYTIVTRETVEMEYAEKRRLFLIEQGYNYEIRDRIKEL